MDGLFNRNLPADSILLHTRGPDGFTCPNSQDPKGAFIPLRAQNLGIKENNDTYWTNLRSRLSARIILFDTQILCSERDEGTLRVL